MARGPKQAEKRQHHHDAPNLIAVPKAGTGLVRLGLLISVTTRRSGRSVMQLLTPRRPAAHHAQRSAVPRRVTAAAAPSPRPMRRESKLVGSQPADGNAALRTPQRSDASSFHISWSEDTRSFVISMLRLARQRVQLTSRKGIPPLIAWSIVGDGRSGPPSAHSRSLNDSQASLSAPSEGPHHAILLRPICCAASHA